MLRFLLAALLAASFAHGDDAALAPVELTLADGEAIGYATFQSHNQKVVANARGIFMTHLRTRDEAYMAQLWRLSRSVDGGRTFTTVYEDTHATNPPVIETDAAGNIYLARMDFNAGDAYLYRFTAENDYADSGITQVPGAAAGKYAMMIDEPRARLYLFSHNNTFHTLGLDGTLLRSAQLIKEGPDAWLQYPLLSLAPDGTLHAAWTTQKRDVYLYWDIHHMISKDGGDTWQTMNATPLTPPVVADQHGPADGLIREDEFEAHTWLSHFRATNEHVFFGYLAQTQPPRQHFIRYDIPTRSRGVDTWPEVRGETIALMGLDGFFATPRNGPEGRLFMIGNDQGHLACLASDDSGATWHDHARATETFNLYGIGGFRDLTADGHIIGSFTDSQSSHSVTDRLSKVYFFRISGK